MRLRLLYRGSWEILAPIGGDDECQVLSSLIELAREKLTRGTAAGFYHHWKRIAPEGPRGLGNEIYRRVDDDNEIYEFRKRDHRLFCFEAEGRVIVCTHISLKRGQKTPPGDKAAAIRIRNEYLAAKQRNEIEVQTDDE